MKSMVYCSGSYQYCEDFSKPKKSPLDYSLFYKHIFGINLSSFETHDNKETKVFESFTIKK